MSEKMKVAVMDAIREMSFVEKPIPHPNDNEVLVKVGYVGICGSDIHYYEQGSIGEFIVEPPFVLGHEAAGTIIDVGKNVKNLKIGDRVAMEPGKTCGHCHYCKTGRYNLCPDVEFFATPPIDGVFQEYVAHEADLCFKLPENVSTLSGALIEPLAVGFHAGIQGGAHFGQTAVVTGAGCIGLMSLLALKALGVDTIYISDVIDVRLEKAKEIGASSVIFSSRENFTEKIMELTNGNGVDLAIDTSGNEICVQDNIKVLKKDGTMVFVGYSKSGMMNLPTGMICDKEINLKSVFRYRHIYPLAIKAVSEGLVDVESIVSNIFEFDDIYEAMEKSVTDKANIVKSAVRIS